MSKNISRDALRSWFMKSEENILEELVAFLESANLSMERAQTSAKELIQNTKEYAKKHLGIESFLQTYPLSSSEGLALMTLSEAYLRIPDSSTSSKMLDDKLSDHNWDNYLGKGSHFLINMATWGLHMGGGLLSNSHEDKNIAQKTLGSLTAPAIRTAAKQGIQVVGGQFILGETIEKALSKSKKLQQTGHTFSYDMLGEAAMTESDALRYFEAYKDAITAVSVPHVSHTPFDMPGVSIKLSAIYSRYEDTHQKQVCDILFPRVLELALLAQEKNVLLTIDAEEADRLELSLDVIEFIFKHPLLKEWEGLGFALQAYQRRAFKVIDWAAELSKEAGKKLYVRLVKGAYWDTEIKRAQERGLTSFPVFTRKLSTDLSYLACAIKLMSEDKLFYVQLATHNAFTISLLLPWITQTAVELQRLHGMGEALFANISNYAPNAAKRIYAPVGGHKDLLAYLVRRLLENGANTSFVNRVLSDKIDPLTLTQNPLEQYHSLKSKENSMINSPQNLYKTRKNSEGLELSDRVAVQKMYTKMESVLENEHFCGAIVDGEEFKNQNHHHQVFSPSNEGEVLGEVCLTSNEVLAKALDVAHGFFPSWERVPVEERARLMIALGDKLEDQKDHLYAILIKEAGKTFNDAIAEVREAIDFCYYYAHHAEKHMSSPEILEGPTGELNTLSLHPRGVFLCISPWNFPLAIFLGQIVAALVTGNTVLAKPSRKTSLIASFVVKLAHSVGIPKQAFQLTPVSGSSLAKSLLSDHRIKGVVFTGSTSTAHKIQKDLTAREGAIVPLIAETGGINTMVVDSSALLEQVTRDVITSAFRSAGQRCSALRLLIVQEDIYDSLMDMIKGAMKELKLGDPWELDTDVGPVIDAGSQSSIEAHIHSMENKGFPVFRPYPSKPKGFYVAPTLVELNNIEELTQEVFGPILHVVKFKGNELEKTIHKINHIGYGLTMGLHSRIDKTIETVKNLAHIGNLYVNRNMIGAVVGTQPFGGEGLSGTGFKAGGPYYLLRFITERTFTHDTTSAGGNVTLMTQDNG